MWYPIFIPENAIWGYLLGMILGMVGVAVIMYLIIVQPWHGWKEEKERAAERLAKEQGEARLDAEVEAVGLTGMQVPLFKAVARRRNYNTDGLALQFLDPEFANRAKVDG